VVPGLTAGVKERPCPSKEERQAADDVAEPPNCGAAMANGIAHVSISHADADDPLARRSSTFSAVECDQVREHQDGRRDEQRSER
jgi:hypothetical protein